MPNSRTISHSLEYLSLLMGCGRYVAVFRAPNSMREQAVIRDAACRDWRLAEGAARIEVPIRTLKYYLDCGFLSGDGEDVNGSDVFRITQAGRAAAEAAR
jgi:hypothetical protein